MKPVTNPTLSSVYEEVKLDLVRQDRSVYEQEMKGSDVYRARRARSVLAAIDAGRQSWNIPIPVHAVGFGDGVVLLALGGEVVVDYSLRLKREYTGTDLIVAGYCNEVPCYVPSRRVLVEGGYEPVDSMIYYGQPGAVQAERRRHADGSMSSHSCRGRREICPLRKIDRHSTNQEQSGYETTNDTPFVCCRHCCGRTRGRLGANDLRCCGVDGEAGHSGRQARAVRRLSPLARPRFPRGKGHGRRGPKRRMVPHRRTEGRPVRGRLRQAHRRKALPRHQ